MMWRVRLFPIHVSFVLLWLCVLPSCSSPGTEPGGQIRVEGDLVIEDREAGVVELTSEMLAHMDIRTAPVEQRVLPPSLETTGQVDFEQDRLAHVPPRIPGRVEQVRADLGATVSKGQILAIIDSIELGQAKSAYLQAKAQEDLARQNYEREKRLYAERIASEKEMLAARAVHLEAVAQLNNAEETLHLYGVGHDQIESLSYEAGKASLLPVRSPLAGTVVEKHVAIGELVTPERNMFTIADLEHVWIWIDIYERNLRHVHLEDDVEVEVDAFPGQRFGGKVSYISDQVDPDTRTVRARIDVLNPEKKLRPGMFASVELTDPHQAAGAAGAPSLVVPQEAVQRDGDLFIVFVKLDKNRFERREVTPGRKAQGLIEVKSGVSLGEDVAVTATFLLKSELSKEQMGAGHDD
ncbi:MAG: efflux RND transporter periplasmic adaptor subunit [Acidobacteriota bacterium]